MALTYTERTADGITDIFSFSFSGNGKGYIRPTDIEVTVDGIATGFTLQTETTLKTETVPASGSIVVIRRVMPYSQPYSDFTRGNTFGKDNVNKGFEQNLYLVQEILDGFFPSGWSTRTDLDMNFNRIYNLGAPLQANDAVRLVDLSGGDTLPSGVTFTDDSYMNIAEALPVPSIEGDIYTLELSIMLIGSVGDRLILSEEKDSDGNKSIYLSSDARTLTYKDLGGVEITEDISALNIPINEKINFYVQTRRTLTGYEHRVGYNGLYSTWTVSNLAGSWSSIMGNGVASNSSDIIVLNMTYSYDSLLNIWSFKNQTTDVVLSTLTQYNGTLLGFWEASLPDNGIIVESNAEDVSFDPTGTGYPLEADDVDAVLRDIDENFIRAVKIEEAPDAPDGTPLVAFRSWLADTTTSARSRPLPSNPNDNDVIVIKDDTGSIEDAGLPVRIITIGRNGKTIMGLEEDLTIESDNSWVELTFNSSLDDWKVTGGGVGAQVKVVTDDVVSFIYPIGHVLFTMNPANPQDYLGVGVWASKGQGRVIAGVGTSSDQNGVSKTIALGNNDGEWEHVQTEEELVPHSHEAELFIRTVDSGNNTVLTSREDKAPQNMPTTKVGEGEAMNITNPMYGIYIWERIE